MTPLRDYKPTDPSRTDTSKIQVRFCRLGLGVFAAQEIGNGEFIAGFYGPIYSAAKASLLPEGIRDHAIQFSEHVWRDSLGAARYLNHSCDPNCYIKDDFEILTLRPVAAGEELTWDYSTTENSDWIVPGGKCLCRWTKCRGTIPPFRDLPIQERLSIAARVGRWLRKGGAKLLPERIT